MTCSKFINKAHLGNSISKMLLLVNSENKHQIPLLNYWIYLGPFSPYERSYIQQGKKKPFASSELQSWALPLLFLIWVSSSAFYSEINIYLSIFWPESNLHLSRFMMSPRMQKVKPCLPTTNWAWVSKSLSSQE